MTEASHYARHPGPPPLRFRYVAFEKRGEARTVHMWLWRGSALVASGFVAWLSPSACFSAADGVTRQVPGVTAPCAWSLTPLCEAAGVRYAEILLEPGNAETIAAARAFFEGAPTTQS